MRYKDRIDTSVFLPQVDWRKASNRRQRAVPVSLASV
jgi:hypothetical protein